MGETQRHIGTLVHAWLARLGQEQTLPTLEMIESERAALHAQLSRCGVPAAEQARAAQLILTALSQTLADERGRWIFSRTHREAHAELALDRAERRAAAQRHHRSLVHRCDWHALGGGLQDEPPRGRGA